MATTAPEGLVEGDLVVLRPEPGAAPARVAVLEAGVAVLEDGRQVPVELLELWPPDFFEREGR